MDARLLLTLALAGLALAAGAPAARAQSDPAAETAETLTPSPRQPPTGGSGAAVRTPFEGVFSIGGIGSDTSGNAVRVGEYDVLRPGSVPQLGIQFWGERGRARFDVLAQHGGDARDQRYRADLDFGRLVKASVSYDRFPHRLDHDPLSYLDASSGIGGTFVVRHDDTDPGAAYSLTHGELASLVEVAVPAAQGLRFFVGHRQELRSGFHQALTTSHCSHCHTTGYTRQIDQRTLDLSAGARLQMSALTLDYTFENRHFKEDAAAPTTVYDRALQPAQLTDVFLNRVQYDERFGSLPFDTTPALRKEGHSLRARVDLPGDASLIGRFTRTTSRNTDSQLEVDFTGGSGRFVMPFGRRLTLRAALRRYDINADSVFVDVNEPIAPAGLSAGLTYAQAYPALGPVDFLRESSLSRTPTDLSVELAYRPFKRTTVRFGYEWEDIRRDRFTVHRTTTNSLHVNARSNPTKTLQFRSRVDYDWIADPFMRERAAIPLVLQPLQSPGNVPFTGLQYFEMYRSRQADLTSFPTRDGLIDQSLTWSPTSRVSVSGHYRWRHASNHDLTASDWQQSMHLPGVELWLAPGDRWNVAAGYLYQRERLETMFSTLAFVG